MIQFANIAILWFLLLLPVAFLIYLGFIRWRRSRLRAIGTSAVLRELLTGADNHNGFYKFIFQVAIFTLIVLACARPQAAGKTGKKMISGGELVICLDVSNSMLAEDIRPSRLVRARQAIASFIRQLDTEQTGLVVFAGEAYIQIPLTSDKAATLMLLNTISPGDITNQGTSIADAITLAVRTFNTGQSGKVRRTIILVSDGEDHEGGAVEEAKLAAGQGITIYSVGVGEPTGVPVPVYTDGVLTGYRKDSQSNTVISALNPKFLTAVAETTGGKFFLSSNLNTSMQRVRAEILKHKGGERAVSFHGQAEEQYRWFVGFALLLLALERMIPYRGSRKKLVEWINGFIS